MSAMAQKDICPVAPIPVVDTVVFTQPSRTRSDAAPAIASTCRRNTRLSSDFRIHDAAPAGSFTTRKPVGAAVATSF